MTKGEFPKSEPFAVRLKRLRDEQGLSASQLAAECGTTEDTISAIESGIVAYPTLPLGLRLAKALHVDPNYLARADAGSATARILECAERLAWAMTDIFVRINALEDASRPRPSLHAVANVRNTEDL